MSNVMLHVGFTGTQRGMTLVQAAVVAAFVCNLEPDWVHHGDCIGADAQFHQIARLLADTGVHLHPPDNDSKRAFCDYDAISTPLPYLQRNKVIVAFSEILIATPAETAEQLQADGEPLRSGTWSTIRYARKSQVTRVIILPDGSTYPEAF